MTKQEIERMFLDGELAIKFFFQSEKYEIGGKTITAKQFETLVGNYRDQSTFNIDTSFWTKHVYKYKAENSLELSNSETK